MWIWIRLLTFGESRCYRYISSKIKINRKNLFVVFVVHLSSNCFFSFSRTVFDQILLRGTKSFINKFFSIVYLGFFLKQGRIQDPDGFFLRIRIGKVTQI